MSRTATYKELARILQERGAHVLRLLELADAQLGIPTDGNGLRVRVSVRPGEATAIPDHLPLELDGETIDIPLERCEDYKDFRPV